MAFIRANFGPLGGQSKRGIGGAPASWAYKSADAHAAIDSAGYFNEVRNLLSIGDLIYVAVVTNLGLSTEALATAGWHVVKDKTTTTVDVTDVTVAVVTDTD